MAAVIFLQDPLTPPADEPDVGVLLEVRDLNDGPLATNLASAEILLRSLSGLAAESQLRVDPEVPEEDDRTVP